MHIWHLSIDAKPDGNSISRRKVYLKHLDFSHRYIRRVFEQLIWLPQYLFSLAAPLWCLKYAPTCTPWSFKGKIMGTITPADFAGRSWLLQRRYFVFPEDVSGRLGNIY
jgi:hypothetical protein